MIIEINMEKIIKKYSELCHTISDINEHLPTLKKYGEECDTIIEMGVRSIVSTWAFLASNPKKLISLDLCNPSKYGGNIDEVVDGVSETNIQFSFIEENSLVYNIDECDLLFIDTWHDYLQLKQELNRHHRNVKKYIILHDTVSYGNSNEDFNVSGIENNTDTNLPKGLWPAVEEFLYNNRNWVVWEKKPNNNGLTVLKRTDSIPTKNILNKKIVLFSTFCDRQDKIDILEKNIRIVKNNGLDVMVISPLLLPQHVVELCDYYFYTKDNHVLEWPVRAMRNWITVELDGETREVSRTQSDYGFAGLMQVKQLSQIALNLGYEQFHHLIYDVKIDENVLNGFKSDKKFNIYPSKRGNLVWEVGLHYMIFNRENLEKFISLITLENYLKLEGTDAFGWLHSIKNTLNYEIEKIPVEDEIYYYENFDFFNYSPIEGVKFFIEKNDETRESIKILFYDVNDIKNIKINVGEQSNQFIFNKNMIVDLGFNSDNYQTVTIEFESIEYDITETIRKIKHNVIK